MTDRRDRNGTEPILVPMPVEPRRVTPVRAEKITAFESEYDLKRKLSDALVQIVPAVNLLLDNDQSTHEHLRSLTRAFNSLSERISGPEIERRAKEASHHEIELVAEQIAEDIKTNPNLMLDQPLTQKDIELRDAKRKLDSIRAQADRRWAIWLVMITVGATLLAGVGARVVEAAIRGHW